MLCVFLQLIDSKPISYGQAHNAEQVRITNTFSFSGIEQEGHVHFMFQFHSDQEI